jgi:putative DNA primase/helicase
MAVAESYRAANPVLRILIAGDNDHQREREIGADGRPRDNVGRLKAEAAAQAVDGALLIPPFDAQQPGSDWNDLAQLLGERLGPVLDAALAAAERRLSASAVRHDDGEQHQQKRSPQATRR